VMAAPLPALFLGAMLEHGSFVTPGNRHSRHATQLEGSMR
jgi:hypothetical protein